jgi:hypothetical protein
MFLHNTAVNADRRNKCRCNYFTEQRKLIYTRVAVLSWFVAGTYVRINISLRTFRSLS